MSQAIIDFCQGLQTTLLDIEDGLVKAGESAERAGGDLAKETREHIHRASRQLSEFRAKAAEIAANVRAELPKDSDDWKERLGQLGLEAQVTLRHAAVFLAEATAKGATGASSLLQKGAERAQSMAQAVRDDTAVVVRNEADSSAARD